MAWTDEMVEDLKKMWQEGLTTGEIGKRLNVSKNSIVGKVHRLGLSGRPSPIKKKDNNDPAAPKAEKKPSPKPISKPVVKPIKEENNKVEKLPLKDKIISEPEAKFIPASPKEKSTYKEVQNISLTELDNHTCRWPLGDPKDENFHFCGKKVRIGQTYCDEHSAIAYVKPNKK
ncbi:MAG: GcrA cell cycle regulator [Alphaproteobacteria bacterium]|nr:GcrA cell cycle regulator [Alphaproteobacteria bacterium]